LELNHCIGTLLWDRNPHFNLGGIENMLSETKSTCLKFGLVGIISSIHKRFEKKTKLLLYMVWFWIIVGIILRKLRPEYADVINTGEMFTLLNNIIILFYMLISELKDGRRDMAEIFFLFDVIENKDEEYFLDRLSEQGITLDKLNNLIESMKGIVKDE
jgi:hypothetical protein